MNISDKTKQTISIFFIRRNTENTTYDDSNINHSQTFDHVYFHLGGNVLEVGEQFINSGNVF